MHNAVWKLLKTKGGICTLRHKGQTEAAATSRLSPFLSFGRRLEGFARPESAGTPLPRCFHKC
jgi:hypothetical protein